MGDLKLEKSDLWLELIDYNGDIEISDLEGLTEGEHWIRKSDIPALVNWLNEVMEEAKK